MCYFRQVHRDSVFVVHDSQQKQLLLRCVCVCVYIYICVCVCVYVYVCMYVCMYVCIYIYIYTGCPRRNVPDFGRVFLMLKYTDITQNTYVQSCTVTEIMAREKCGLLAGPRSVPVS